MPSEIKTPCPGYASYRLFEDGRVEVNGSFPTHAEGSKQAARMIDMWEKYGVWVDKYAKENSMPVPWIMGIMGQESGGNPNACSPCTPDVCSFAPNCPGGCCAFGLMQFIDSTAKRYGHAGVELLGNPELSIDLACRFIRELGTKVGMDLVRIGKAYNGGGFNCSGGGTFGAGGQGDYMMQIVRYANTFVALGLAPPQSSIASSAAVLIAFAALGFFAYKQLDKSQGYTQKLLAAF